MPSPPRPIKSLTIPRREIAWLVGAILLGAVLRLGYPGRMAIDHFDEGVYASNFWFGEDQGYAYPARHLYAPPLLPAAIEWTLIITSLCGVRPSGFIPMIPSLIAGLLTIPSLWWVGRRWFGPTAGIAAAWLIAASDLHASYSRAALTDVPVCLFILWGIYFLKQALESGTGRDLLLASIFTSLAWWTKYNGWLPLAVGLSGGIAWQMVVPRSERMWGTVLKRWSIVAGLSFLLWSPVLIGLQKQGGYQAVAANHRQYINGLNRWWPNAIHQGLNAGIYDNIVGIPVEIWAVSVQQRMRASRTTQPSEQDHPTERIAAHRFSSVQAVQPVRSPFARDQLSATEKAVISPTAIRLLLLVTPSLLLLAATAGIAIRLVYGCGRAARPEGRTRRTAIERVPGTTPIEDSGRATPRQSGMPQTRNDQLSQLINVWFVFAWIGGLCVATPFYQPYPRLILPLLVALWLAAGLFVQSMVELQMRQDGRGWRFLSGLRLEWCLPAALICCVAIRCQMGTFHAWQDRTEMAVTVKSLSRMIQDQTEKAGFAREEAIVYVAGDPAVFFALKSDGLPLVAPIQNQELAERGERPTFVVFRQQAGSRPDPKSNRVMVSSAGCDRSHLALLDAPGCYAVTEYEELEVERLP